MAIVIENKVLNIIVSMMRVSFDVSKLSLKMSQERIIQPGGKYYPTSTTTAMNASLQVVADGQIILSPGWIILSKGIFKLNYATNEYS